MEITIKDLENDLKSLPKELLKEVSDYVAFLKFKYGQDSNEVKLEDWQKEILDERLLYLEKNPNDTLDFENTIAELKKKYT
ncbi:hypothetical protein [Epilithonimonas sp.]|uniref:hypothetical protein n=1 Tax=Epilithonimonas sp. TaxID=2894511 RepID=UPI00289BE73D|nr:hypothetical protein [Epilithonimonas sp.]